jgi:hypothetical protein
MNKNIVPHRSWSFLTLCLIYVFIFGSFNDDFNTSKNEMSFCVAKMFALKMEVMFLRNVGLLPKPVVYSVRNHRCYNLKYNTVCIIYPYLFLAIMELTNNMIYKLLLNSL